MDYFFPRNRSFSRELMFFYKTSLSILEVGDGLLAVENNGQFNTHFDTGRWGLTVTVRGAYRGQIFPSGLENCGVLPGELIKGGVTTHARVVAVVQKYLKPMASHYELVTEASPEGEVDFASIFEIFKRHSEFFSGLNKD